MDIALWVVQGLLAAAFFISGLLKVIRSKEALKQAGGARMAWVDDISDGNLRLIGVLEVLAAIGLILPPLTGILPSLTIWAAVGLVVVMLGAAGLHVRRQDGAQSIMTNLVLLLLAAFVAYGRLMIAPY